MMFFHESFTNIVTITFSDLIGMGFEDSGEGELGFQKLFAYRPGPHKIGESPLQNAGTRVPNLK